MVTIFKTPSRLNGNKKNLNLTALNNNSKIQYTAINTIRYQQFNFVELVFKSLVSIGYLKGIATIEILLLFDDYIDGQQLK